MAKFAIKIYPIIFLFVEQVMKETRTKIFWPSKLKIGAKSKKGWCKRSIASDNTEMLLMLLITRD